MTQPLNSQQAYPSPGGANAVSINIFNPQAYGSAPSNANQAVPYAYTNSLYQMPQASAYQQQQVPAAYQQYMPIAQQPQFQQPQIVQQQFQQPIVPAPQVMPPSVLEQPVVENQQVAVQPTQQPAIENQQPAVAETKNSQQTPEIVEPTNPAPAQQVNIDELTQNLASADVDKKAETINKVAELAQKEPEVALQVVSEPIMNGLINIINEDTTNLEGPTDKQIEIAQKIANNEKLTPEEDALSEQLSPRDKANKNRIFALYTLAMIQKLQREELNQYIEQQKANGQQAIPQLQIEELPGYNDIVNIINNDPRQEVKVAAIQALQYIAEPQDKEKITAALDGALKSNDETVKAAAQELIDRFAAAPAQNTTQQAA